MTEQVELTELRTDGGTQPRSEMDIALVAEYAEAMKRGDTFPPIEVVYDGEHYWVTDGFHRKAAAIKAGRNAFDVEVKQGDHSDAKWLSLGANATHGKRRTRKDKRRAIKRALRMDAEFSGARDGWHAKSDRQIAAHVGCSWRTVGKYRAKMEEEGVIESSDSRRGADGKVQPAGTTPHEDDIREYAKTHPDASNREIAREFGVSDNTVSRVLESAQVGKLPTCAPEPDPKPQRDPAQDAVDEYDRMPQDVRESAGEGMLDGREAKRLSGLKDTTRSRARESLYDGEDDVDSAVHNATVSANSANGKDGDEWYTPKKYTDAAREAMGSIDLDPASTKAANAKVGADEFYTKDDDGLKQDWHGNVWVNPPYSYPLVEEFVDKAISEYQAGRCDQCIIIVNNCTDTKWFHKMLSKYPVCFPKGRVQFWRENQESFATRQGQALFYLGPNVRQFADAFDGFGVVLSEVDGE